MPRTKPTRKSTSTLKPKAKARPEPASQSALEAVAGGPKPKVVPDVKPLLGHARIAPKLKGAIGATLRGSAEILDDDKRVYRDKLDELRGKAQQAIPAIAREYDALPPDRHQERFALVHLLTEIAHPDALPKLEHIAMSEIAGHGQAAGSALRVQGEAMVHMMAVEGIGRLAATGHAEARESLLKLVRHSSFSIRREAVQQYLQSGGPEAREKLKSLLPKEEHFILDIRVIAPHELPRLPRPAKTRLPGRGAEVTIPPAESTGKLKARKPRKGEEHPQRGGNND